MDIYSLFIAKSWEFVTEPTPKASAVPDEELPQIDFDLLGKAVSQPGQNPSRTQPYPGAAARWQRA